MQRTLGSNTKSNKNNLAKNKEEYSRSCVNKWSDWIGRKQQVQVSGNQVGGKLRGWKVSPSIQVYKTAVPWMATRDLFIFIFKAVGVTFFFI